MGNFTGWLKLSVEISNNPLPLSALYCPECLNSTVDFQYVGDSEMRIGYLDVWCNSCSNGIHISRVRMPESAKLLEFNDASLIDRIPSFNQITR
jgi:hypothetical protein